MIWMLNPLSSSYAFQVDMVKNTSSLHKLILPPRPVSLLNSSKIILRMWKLFNGLYLNGCEPKNGFTFYIFSHLWNKDTIGQNLVSFKQHKRFFAPYMDSLRGLKDSVVYPLIEMDMNGVVVLEQVLDNEGSPVIEDTWDIMEIVILLFHFF